MDKTTTKEENLKGKVKSVFTKGEGKNFVKMKFDRKGRLIERETAYLFFHNYIYDEKDKLISHTLLVKSGKDVEVKQAAYDKQGFLTSGFYGDCENDSRGNCISEKRSYGEIKRIYDEKDRVVEDWFYYGENNIIHSWGTDLTTGMHWEKDEIMPSEGIHTTYKYNDRGDVILCQQIDTDRPLTDTITYKYDDKGNWTERAHTTPFGCNSAVGEITGHTVTRKIKYYD